MPHHRTWLMVHDAGPLGLEGHLRAGVACPCGCSPAFRAGVDTHHALEAEGQKQRGRNSSRQRMLERFLTQPKGATREDMDYLIEKLDQVRREADRETRRRA